jgi:hypothetical protein
LSKHISPFRQGSASDLEGNGASAHRQQTAPELSPMPANRGELGVLLESEWAIYVNRIKKKK